MVDIAFYFEHIVIVIIVDTSSKLNISGTFSSKIKKKKLQKKVTPSHTDDGNRHYA